MSVRLPDYNYHLIIEPPDREDPNIAKYLEQCSEQDYVSPLLGLMAEAAKGSRSLREQTAWILRIYRQIIDLRVEDGLRKEIALSSASSLIEALNGLYNGQSYRSYYSVNYNTAYKIEYGDPPSDLTEFEGSADVDNLKELTRISCLDLDSVVRSGAYLSNEDYANQLNQHNPVSFFLQVWTMADSILWDQHSPVLRRALLREGLIRVFPEKGELYHAYLELFPSVSHLFDLARNRRIQLSTLPDDSSSIDCCVLL